MLVLALRMLALAFRMLVLALIMLVLVPNCLYLGSHSEFYFGEITIYFIYLEPAYFSVICYHVITLNVPLRDNGDVWSVVRSRSLNHSGGWMIHAYMRIRDDPRITILQICSHVFVPLGVIM